MPYEGEDRCPRVHIHEEPGWWADVINHHDAYRNSILPNEGGLSDQPALFLPIMTLVSNSLQQERDLAEATKARRDAMIERSKANMAATGGGRPMPRLGKR